MTTVDLFLRNTQTEPGAGGSVYDFADEQGSPDTTVTGSTGENAFTEILRWTITRGVAGASGSHDVNVSIESIDSNFDVRWRLEHRSSADALKASSGWSAEYNTPGNKNDTLTLSAETWASGDRLQLAVEGERGGMPATLSVNIRVQNAASYVRAPVTPLNITTATLPDANRTVAYSEFVEVEGGIPPYTWSLLSGTLPSGLSLNTTTGEISGTPDTEATYNFTIRVTDDDAATDDQAYTIVVGPPAVVMQSSNDGRLNSTDSDGNYEAAREGTSNFGLNNHLVETGQAYTSSITLYSVRQAFIEFDTSAIPNDAVIKGEPKLEIYGVSAGGDGPGFVMEVREHDWGGTLTESDFVPGSGLAAKTLWATFTIPTWAIDDWNEFTAETGFAAALNREGMTRIVIASSRQRTGDAPTGTEWRRGQNSTDAPQFAAKLTVELEDETGVSATITGVTATATAAALPGTVATAQGSTISGALATADAAALPGTVETATTATVSGQPATAIAASLAGTVAAVRSVTISGAVATADAAALPGTVASQEVAAVAGVIAAADSAALPGTVDTGAVVSVAGELATATAAALPGTVAAERNVTITGTVATAGAATLAGEVSTVVPATVSGEPATASAAALAGTVAAVEIVTVSGESATASAAALPGEVATGAVVTVAGVPATATAVAIAGTVATENIVTVSGALATSDAAAIAGTVETGDVATIAGAVAAAGASAVAGVVSTEQLPYIVAVLPDTFNEDDLVDILGSNFGAISGRVVLSPTDNVDDPDAVDQTVTAWADDEITFTVVR